MNTVSGCYDPSVLQKSPATQTLTIIIYQHLYRCKTHTLTQYSQAVLVVYVDRRWTVTVPAKDSDRGDSESLPKTVYETEPCCSEAAPFHTDAPLHQPHNIMYKNI